MVSRNLVARIGRRSAAALLMISAATAQAGAQSWGQYGVTVHTTPQQQFFLSFVGVTNSGQVQGSTPGGAAAIFSPAGGVTALPNLPGSNNANAYTSNSAGQAAGFVTVNSGFQQAAVWSGGSGQNIGTLGGDYSYAFGMNDLGQVVGTSNLAGNTQTHAFLWTQNGMLDLGTFGGTVSTAYSINNTGQIAGYSTTAGNAQQVATLWTNGVGTSLGTLGGTFSAGYSVNASGQVSGYSATSGNSAQHAFVWSSGIMHDLGTLGGAFSIAYGLSDAGQAIGYATDANNVFSAAIWEQANGAYQAYDLASIVNDGVTNSGWIFREARGISANGQWVSAYAENQQLGYSGWVILEAGAAPPVTATPEPASMSLMATGLFGLAGWARRRRKARS